jgi:hypothetical protein
MTIHTTSPLCVHVTHRETKWLYWTEDVNNFYDDGHMFPCSVREKFLDI